MENKICAYCQREISMADYRVYCPSCHADFHKDCWVANHGCVTPGCEYNKKFAGVCAFCHTPIQKNYNFCKKCGRPTNPLSNYIVYPQGSIYRVPESEAETAEMLMGEKGEEFMKSFAEAEQTKFKLSFNLHSFLFTGFWYIWRRMYTQGIAILLLFALLAVSIVFFPGMRLLSIPLLLLLWAGCAFCSNGIYMEHIRKVAGEALKVPANLRREYMNKHGGTDKKATIIAAVASAVFFIIFTVLVSSVI